MCGGCDGECPNGVPYDRFLRAMMYHDGYENDRLAADVVRSTVASQVAERCSECPSCLAVCRRGIDIQAQITLVQQILGDKSA
jgi:ferredoxin